MEILDIFTMDLETRVVERITEHSSIDTSPSFSPDGKYICLILTEAVSNKFMLCAVMALTLKELLLKRNLWNTCLVSKRGFDCLYKSEKDDFILAL